MSKKATIIIASLVTLLGVALLGVPYLIPLQQTVETGFLEKIETQDPGYLRLPVSILEPQTYEAVTFDPRAGKPATISFRLTRPAPIRVRIVRKDRPEIVLRTLMDFKLLQLGRHDLTWDGRDASGNITENRMIHLVIEGMPKPHLPHSREKCHDLKVTFLTPSGDKPTLPRTASIIAQIVGDPAYGPESGYRMRGLIDWRPWFDKNYAKDAKAFELPPLPELAAGDHLLTLNVEDGQDHVGAALMPFSFAPGAAAAPSSDSK